MTTAPPPTPLDERWQAARRVLLIRLDNLGDVLMSTPAFAAVRQALPEAHLTLLGSPSGTAALPHLPMLDDAIVYRAPWVAAGTLESSAQQDRQLLDRLTAEAFDAAIIFTVATQSALPAALLCRQAGIPLCLGHARENPYLLMSDWVKDADVVRPGMRHEVQRQLDLVAQVGFPAAPRPLSFKVRAEDFDGARQKLARAAGRHLDAYALIHPGATAASRRYDPRAFGEAAWLMDAAGLPVVFAGGEAESALIDTAIGCMQTAGTTPAAIVCGHLTLGELAALIADARVLVANNSAPAHIASAVGTPLVDLYALTNPQHTPWMARSTVLSHEVPCRDCLRSVCPHGLLDCLRHVTPAALAWAPSQGMHLLQSHSSTDAARRIHAVQEASIE
jgi:ADP-heptose:LPS heptosyltransferase